MGAGWGGGAGRGDVCGRVSKGGYAGARNVGSSGDRGGDNISGVGKISWRSDDVSDGDGAGGSGGMRVN